MAAPDPAGADFPHIRLLYRDRRPAQYHGGGATDPRVKANKADRRGHSQRLGDRLRDMADWWQRSNADRAAAGLPVIEAGVPFVIELDDRFDLDELVDRFKLDVVADDWVSAENGRKRYVLVATEQILDSDLLRLVAEFAEEARGSAAVASVMDIVADPADPRRLELILSPTLLPRWPFPPGEEFVLDVSFQTRGIIADLGNKPRKGRREAKEEHSRRVAVWFNEKKTALYQRWDEFSIELEDEVVQFIEAYQGQVVEQWEDQTLEVSEAIARFPDSVSFRIRMNGAGFHDLILNHPRIFEVQEPEEMAHRLDTPDPEHGAHPEYELLPPDENAPLVCVIDSGIQEGHRLLRSAMKTDLSICLVPGKQANDVADEVPGGHGTSVAGAVIYPTEIPNAGSEQAPCSIGNARVLDDRAQMSMRLYPPSMLERIASHFAGCRIFTHSITTKYACPLRHMTAWAAKIDELSYRQDALFFVSAGNIPQRQGNPGKGILDHIASGIDHPEYLLKASARIATPAQSLQALVVGSIAHADFDDGAWVSIAEKDEPSAFSRSGLGIWETLKPDVVEYGGDLCIPKVGEPTVAVYRQEVCPHLVRSTRHGGPETGKDKAGTSFAAPKVAALAVQLARQFPNHSTLLYRALIAQSARWPAWAEALNIAERKKAFQMIGYGLPDWRRALHNETHRVTLITSETYELKAGEALVFEVPVPEELRAAGEENSMRVDVTLSYVTEPRRTRASLKGYQAVWLDWCSTRQLESMQNFVGRMWTDENSDGVEGGDAIPWMLSSNTGHGQSRGISREGTLQKDWARLSAFDIGESLGIAVRGHKGWNQGDPDAVARFVLVVSFEAEDPEVRVYEPIRVAVQNRIRVEEDRIRV